MRSTRRSRARRATLLLTMCTFSVAGTLEAGALTGQTSRVSVSFAEVQANGHSFDASVSKNGRFVAFASMASNLIGSDTNGFTDIFVRDRRTGTTKRVSLNSGGKQSNGDSAWTSISADGRFVAFESEASNLVRGDTNGARDVFVRDLETRVTRRVSVSSRGRQGNGPSDWASISADGRFVAFSSAASNLVRGDTNLDRDIFVRDLETGRTRRVSRSSEGSEAADASYSPSISADGRFVAFNSRASNLVGGDLNASYDVFVHDRETGRTRRVSVSSNGTEANGNSGTASLSADGQVVVFDSDASNLVGGDTNSVGDAFVRDRATGTTTRISVSSAGIEANSVTYDASISADGRVVAFRSAASNLVGGEDTNNFSDIFHHDRETGITSRVSVNSAGTIQGNAGCFRPMISADGRFITFETEASSLIVGDTNAVSDIYMRGPLR